MKIETTMGYQHKYDNQTEIIEFYVWLCANEHFLSFYLLKTQLIILLFSRVNAWKQIRIKTHFMEGAYFLWLIVKFWSLALFDLFLFANNFDINLSLHLNIYKYLFLFFSSLSLLLYCNNTHINYSFLNYLSIIITSIANSNKHLLVSTIIILTRFIADLYPLSFSTFVIIFYYSFSQE